MQGIRNWLHVFDERTAFWWCFSLNCCSCSVDPRPSPQPSRRGCGAALGQETPQNACHRVMKKRAAAFRNTSHPASPNPCRSLCRLHRRCSTAGRLAIHQVAHSNSAGPAPRHHGRCSAEAEPEGYCQLQVHLPSQDARRVLQGAAVPCLPGGCPPADQPGCPSRTQGAAPAGSADCHRLQTRPMSSTCYLPPSCLSRATQAVATQGTVAAPESTEAAAPVLPKGYHLYETMLILRPTFSDEERCVTDLGLGPAPHPTVEGA